ncbi:hypothetical protein GCM10008938_36970 [Deinococcus roseus]|uniref:DUF4253 domain-containing protein n=2 Tax=Deinococcus roseus TaxID=392414 RepID=A0ABQ2D7B4_9DEIO|nr:hypothetical protein GCM10008938_36970 [Deinococcus roseus]
MGMFSDADTWHGGYVELRLELEEQSDLTLSKLTRCLWNHPSFHGVYLERQADPQDQARHTVEMVLQQPPETLLLRGWAVLPGGEEVACMTSVVREPEGSDWFDLSFPLGSLGKHFPVHAYPFDLDQHDPEPWLKPLEDWLAVVAMEVFEQVPFDLGLVGFDQYGSVCAADVRESGIPEQRYWGYIWPTSEDLQYFARTEP